jgi:transcriptional regulator with XRE-family HTH domain/tetratricopeptide (TPR) repeat protein
MVKRLDEPNGLLRAARKKRCWTLEQACEEVGVCYASYANWELGQRPSLHSLKLLTIAFGMTPEELGYASLVQEKGAGASTKPPTSIHPLTTGTLDMLDIATLAFALAKQQHGWSPHELRLHFEGAIRRIEMIEQPSGGEGLTRRQAIILLSGLPIALLGLTQEGSTTPLFGEELLPLCATSLPACWELYFDGGHAEVERVLPTYLSKLAILAQQPSPHQKQAANFASQAYQLAAEMAKYQENFNEALMYSTDALKYAHLAEDAHLQVAALIRRGIIYANRRYPTFALQAYQEALPLLTNVSPLLVGRVYAGLAEAHASLGQESEGLRYMGLARDTYPTDPSQDPSFPYTRHTHFSLHVNGEGTSYLRLGQFREALNVFIKVEDDVFAHAKVGPRQSQIVCLQAETALALGNLDQGCLYLEKAATTAQASGSRLYYHKALDTYESMQRQESWKHEKKVKQLAEVFQPW